MAEHITVKPKPPCGKNCAERSATCHCTCERWAEYEKERNKDYEDRARRRNELGYVIEKGIKTNHDYHRRKRR